MIECQREDTNMLIGILALQGGVKEHGDKIRQLGHEVLEVRRKEDLAKIQGLILPGGESTTISKLLIETGLMESLKVKIKEGLPILATCAGLILLAKEVQGEELITLGILDIEVKRNAFGRQLGSFVRSEEIKGVGEEPFPLIFIRGPLVTKVGEGIEVVHSIKEGVVAVAKGNILALSFHPELSTSLAIHQNFIENIKNGNHH